MIAGLEQFGHMPETNEVLVIISQEFQYVAIHAWDEEFINIVVIHNWWIRNEWQHIGV